VNRKNQSCRESESALASDSATEVSLFVPFYRFCPFFDLGSSCSILKTGSKINTRVNLSVKYQPGGYIQHYPRLR
jgi:hypothetical protein